MATSDQDYSHRRRHRIDDEWGRGQDHAFPGGTTKFLRSDGVFAEPPGGENEHPDLAAHDTLGLATQQELTDHAATEHGGSHPDLAAHNTLGLATQAELDAHEASADPHIVYQRESEKGMANGYASLDANGDVPDGQIPDSIARDSELPDLAGHVAAADPHTGYVLESAHGGTTPSGHHAAFVQADHDALANPHHSNANDHARQHSITSASDHTFPGGSTFLRADGQFASPPGGSEAFPVGSVFIAVVSTNPATLLGYGTWSSFAAGRVLVGIDSGDADFDTVEETGGAKTHTLVANEMPSHTHVQNAHQHVISHVRSATTGGATTHIAKTDDTSSTLGTATLTDNATPTNQNTGGGAAHNNLQPYIAVYVWKRTA